MPDSQVLGTAGRATPPGRDADTGLSLQAGLRVERRCHAFEREWRDGRAPGIESYLADSPPEDRPGLLAALLPLEWEYRVRRGEAPDAGEYRRRFPEVGSHFTGPDSPTPAPRLPDLPNYEVIRELGRGGMGLVCLANDRRLDRPVALKVMLGGELASTELRRRFLAEARSAARLRHPNIVQIYEVAEAAGLPVLVLEYVAGGTLKQRLAAGRLPLREVAELMRQLALAVHHAHENGVIHRDLKPQNVLLAPGGLVPKLADFGLAKAASEAAGLTRTGEALGTPAYMAPEQFAGRPELIGPPTDVYGLGAVLYELLTGGPPFAGDSPADVARWVTEGVVVPPRKRNAAIPADLEAVCLRCLDSAPARRYQTAADLAADLGRWLAGKATVARPLSLPRRGWRAMRRRPGVAGVVVLVTASLVVAAGVREADPRRQMTRELAAGRRVELIGETGLPRWHQWRLGPAPLAVSNIVFDGTCSFQSAECSLLELAADLMTNRYRLRAEIRQDSGKPDTMPLQNSAVGGNQAGIYFGHRPLTSDDGAEVCQFFVVRFGEQWLPGERPGPGHRHRAYCELVTLERRPGEGVRRNAHTLGAVRFDPTDRLPGPWRRVAVEVTPEGLTADWGTTPDKTERIGEWGVGELTALANQRAAPFGPSPQAGWSPRVPLGVYAIGCAISVRNVVLEPLP